MSTDPVPDVAPLDRHGVAELPPRRVFRDDAHEVAWRRDGFLIADGFSAAQVGELLDLVEHIFEGTRDGFHSSLQSADVGYRRSVLTEVAPRLDDLAAELFVDYGPFAASLTIKWPGSDSTLPCHQDWTMVDESEFRTINIWCPLIDTTERNGALRALPGSHRVLDHLRCSPTNPHWFDCGANDVPLEELDLLEVDRGCLVVFDQGVLHGSGPNASGFWRPAITVAYKPAEAALLHHHVSDPAAEEVDVYEVDASFYTEFTIGEAPDVPPTRRRPFHGTPRTSREIVTLSRRVSAGRSTDVNDSVDPRDATDANLGGHENDAGDNPGAVELPPTFVDPTLQATFARDGYVVVDLVDEAALERLRDAAAGVFSGDEQGMHATNMVADTAYRRRVYEVMCPLLEPLVSPMFVDHEAVAAILLLKFPGEDSQFVSHQDWTLVDERRFRAVNVWIPLVDVGQANGTIGVVPGSHRLLRSVRCDPTYPSYYSPPGWDMDPDEMVPLTVRTGQAVVFDLALLHSSPPNRSDETRSAVAITMKPRDADLLHWFLPAPEATELEVYDVDVDFLMDFELGRRPEYPLVATTPFEPDDVDSAQLRELCLAGAPGRAAADSRADRPAPVPGPASAPELQESASSALDSPTQSASESAPGRMPGLLRRLSRRLNRSEGDHRR